MVGTRLPLDQLRALVAECKRKGTTTPAELRRALSAVRALTADMTDPTKRIAGVAVALGLPKDAEPEEVSAAFQALIGQLPAPGDPAAEAPEPPPTAALATTPKAKQPPPPPQALSQRRGAPAASPRKLSWDMRSRIKARGMTEDEFLARRATVTRRA